MKKYYLINPEVAGQLGEGTIIDYSIRPFKVNQLEYQFQGWLGDDLLECHPCFICTHYLRMKLEATVLTGYIFDVCKISKSDTFNELYPGKDLPVFYWLKVIGKAGDDFILSSNGSMMVTEDALKVLKSANINHCDFYET
jgi:hypothetical protein